MSRARKHPGIWLPAVPAALVAAAVATPLVYLAVRASSDGVAKMASVALDPRTLGLLGRTCLLAGCVTASALVIGLPLAWLVTRTDLPARRVWAVTAALPLVIPSYIGAFTLLAAAGPRGFLQGWLEPLGVQRLPSIYGFSGAWLVLTLLTYPYVLLTVTGAIRGLDPSLEEAARTLGRSRREVAARVILPQLRPAIATGSLLVALYTLRDFGAVSLLQYDSFTRAIYLSYQGSFDRTPAAVLSLVLVFVSLLVVSAEARTRGRAAYHPVHTGAARAPKVGRLRRWRWPVFVACSIVVGLSLILPVGVIAYWAYRLLQGPAAEVIRATTAAGANSLWASAAGALVCVAAALPVARLAARRSSRSSRMFERASFVGYALPGVVVALGLIFLGIRAAPFLYQTRTMLVFAYLVLFLPQAVGPAKAAFLQISPRLDEAARTLGAGAFNRFRKVTLPLAAPGLATGAALVFLTVMKELPATLLLSPAGFSSLATRVWSATTEGLFARAAPAALALVALSAVPLALLARNGGGLGARRGLASPPDRPLA